MSESAEVQAAESQSALGTASSSEGDHPLAIPFAVSANGNADADADLFLSDAAADGHTAPDVNPSSSPQHVPQLPDEAVLLKSLDVTSNGDSAAEQRLTGSAQDSSNEKLTQQLSQLQLQLREAQHRSDRLEAELSKLESDHARELDQLQRRLQEVSDQSQEQNQVLKKQRIQFDAQMAQEQRAADMWRNGLNAAKQQTTKLQAQLSEQLRDMKQADSVTAALKRELAEAQQHLLSVQADLSAYQQEADSQLSQQLHEQQQAVQETQQALRSAQAELQDVSTEFQASQAELQKTQAELELSRQNVLTAQEQGRSSQQSLAERDAVWQEELQHQQLQTSKLQMVRAVLQSGTCHSEQR